MTGFIGETDVNKMCKNKYLLKRLLRSVFCCEMSLDLKRKYMCL